MLEAFQMLDVPTEWASAKLNIRRIAPIVLVIFVGGACVAILLPFLSLITWAAILAYVSWPLYRGYVGRSGVFKMQPRFV